MSRPSETASPPLDRRWAPILNEVRQGRLESSLKPLRHISAHPDEPQPHMTKPACARFTPAHRQPTSTTAPAWTPSSAPPSTSATSTADCSAGSGGSGRILSAQRAKRSRLPESEFYLPGLPADVGKKKQE